MNNDKYVIIYRNTDINLRENLKINDEAIKEEVVDTPFTLSVRKSITQHSNRFQGAIEYLIGCLVFTFIMMIYKYTNVHYSYIPILTQNFYRSIIIAIISYVIMKNQISNEEILKNTINSEYRQSILYRSLVAFINFVSLTACSNFLRLTTSTTFTSLSPIVTAFFATIFLNEKVTKVNIICLIVSLIGCLFLAKPFNNNSDGEDLPIGYISAAVFLLSRSGTVILQKKLSDKVNLQALMFSLSLVSVVLSFVLLIIQGDIILLHGIKEYILLFISGFVFYIGQLLIFRAVGMANIVFLQMFYPSIILFGFIISLVIFNEQHDIYDYFGASLVLAINIYNSYDAYLEYKSNNKI